ncbi:MAG: 3D domain-containing protein [Acidimicrobiaceae bacterium]|nr:3D domain-containing protein [Acidimicrobiaceae bacterium]
MQPSPWRRVSPGRLPRPVAAATLPILAAGSLIGPLGLVGSASAVTRTALPTSLWAAFSAAPSLAATVSSLNGPGQVASFGDAPVEGQPAATPGATAATNDVVGIARTPSGDGYWVATASGGVFTYGDAHFYGSAGNMTLDKPIVGIAATPSGHGYWLVASDGGVFTFGDATFHGSMGGQHLNEPVVGIAATPSGNGYWLAASDGGVFTFGDARYQGSLGNVHLDKPVVGIASTGTGAGYWMVGSDGGVFTFGDATFHGSLPSMGVSQDATAIAPSPSGDGYWIAAADGGVYSFGDALYRGSVSATSSEVRGLAPTPDGEGYWEVTGDVPPPPPPPPAPDPPAPAPAPVAATPVATSASGAPAGFTSLGTFEVTCYDLTGLTATGVQAGPGIVAVDPGVIPLGSSVWIQGVGTVSAQDTGGAIIGNHIDLWLSPGACYSWGLEYRQVAVS